MGNESKVESDGQEDDQREDEAIQDIRPTPQLRCVMRGRVGRGGRHVHLLLPSTLAVVNGARRRGW